MPKLSAVVANKATVSVELGGEAVTVTYRPHRMNPELQERIARAQGAEGIQAALYGPVAELLIDWDLTHDDGSPIPPNDLDALRQIPSPLLLAIVKGILEDARPNPSKRDAFNSGSPQTAASEPRRIGTAS